MQKLQLLSLPSFFLVKKAALSQGLAGLELAATHLEESSGLGVLCPPETKSAPSFEAQNWEDCCRSPKAAGGEDLEVALFSFPAENFAKDHELPSRSFVEADCCCAESEGGEEVSSAAEPNPSHSSLDVALCAKGSHRRTAVFSLHFRMLAAFFSLFDAEPSAAGSPAQLRWRRLTALFFPHLRLSISGLFLSAEGAREHARTESLKWKSLAESCPPDQRVCFSCVCGESRSGLFLRPSTSAAEAAAFHCLGASRNEFSWERLVLPSQQKLWFSRDNGSGGGWSLPLQSVAMGNPLCLPHPWPSGGRGAALRFVSFDLRRVQLALSNVAREWLTNETFSKNVRRTNSLSAARRRAAPAKSPVCLWFSFF